MRTKQTNFELRWYFCSLKAWGKRPASWLQMLALVVLLLLFSKITFPSGENCLVGICYEQGKGAEPFVERLKQAETVFQWIPYETEETMRQDIAAGVLECGVTLPDDMQQRMEAGDTHSMISYYATPFSTKGSVVQETIYATFFACYSNQVLQKKQEEVFGAQDVGAVLAEKNEAYQNSNAIFAIHQEEAAQEKVENKATKPRPLRGMAALLLFVLCLQALPRLERSAPLQAVSVSTRRRCRYLGLLAAITVPALGCLPFVLQDRRHSIGVELLLLVGYVLATALFVSICGCFLKKETTFAAWTVTLTVLQVILAPIFMELGQTIPGLQMVARVLPITWYLTL